MFYYLIFWLINCLITLFFIIKNKNKLLITSLIYINFLIVKWKIITIIFATIWVILTWIISKDPTWDIWISLWISFLYFYTSPYVIWIFYRFFNWLYKDLLNLYISIILLLFSSSWFYDWYNFIYLHWYYPETWISNFVFSIPIYIIAGMFWSLEYENWKWVFFSFQKKEWIEYISPKWSFKNLLIYILIIVFLLVYIFTYFLYYFLK